MKITAFVISVFFCLSLHAQDSCEVKMESIKGTYSGGCVKGKADGQGTAKGTDVYEGTFKGGYPDGKGKYTWKNGSYYVGSWKKGIKEGAGEMMEQLPNGTVKMIKGFWKKDQYKGEHENSYIVYTSSSEISRTEFSSVKSKNNEGTVRIEMKNGTGMGAAITGSSNATAIRMTNFRVMTGIYVSKNTNTLSNSEITTFRNVQFPFRIVLYYDNRTIDFEIYDAASWDVVLTANR